MQAFHFRSPSSGSYLFPVIGEDLNMFVGFRILKVLCKKLTVGEKSLSLAFLGVVIFTRLLTLFLSLFSTNWKSIFYSSRCSCVVAVENLMFHQCYVGVRGMC